jgi:site-specific DNA-methyltransferase (adenine-specific)
MESNKVYLGDCLELMPNHIEDKSIDMILCDLPYGTTQCKWDSIIDLDKLWNEYERVIKDNGVIVLFGAQPFTSALVMSNPKMFKYDWTWKKNRGTGHLNAKKQPMRDKEDILVFYKKQCNYYPQGLVYTGVDNNRLSRQMGRTELYGSEKHFKPCGMSNYPKQVLEFDKIATQKCLHPTQKPLDLIQYLIKTYTTEGDLILDNACGSGTTGVGAKNLNRKYILMELDPKFYDITVERLNR